MAELANEAGWELLVDLCADLGQSELALRFGEALSAQSGARMLTAPSGRMRQQLALR